MMAVAVGLLIGSVIGYLAWLAWIQSEGWRLTKVRAFGQDNYIRLTPNFGFSIPWFRGTRIRFARHHGLQLVKWVGGQNSAGEPIGRWYVKKQVLGKSTVRGERYLKGAK